MKNNKKMVRLKNVIVVLLFLFLIQLTLAATSYNFQKDEAAELIIPCVNSTEYPCTNATLCNATIVYPNGSILVDNEVITFKQNGYYNYSLTTSQTSVLGEYSSSVNCLGSENGFATFNYKITRNGEDLSTSNGIVYVVVLILAALLFGLCAFGAIKIPWKNPRDTEGNIIYVNSKKYIKIILFFFAYLLLTYVSSILNDISQSYLTLSGAGGLFEIVYIFLLIGIIPLFWVLLIMGLIALVADSKIQKALVRGLQMN